jgi:hypothetical protein
MKKPKNMLSGSQMPQWAILITLRQQVDISPSENFTQGNFSDSFGKRDSWKAAFP